MKKSLALLAVAALLASATTSFAGGLNAAIEENTVTQPGPTARKVPVGAIVPVVLCLIICTQNGDDTGGTGGTRVTTGG